jgi:hypothetical protein
MAVEGTQEFKEWREASAQWLIFDKVKQDCPDKNHVPHRHAKDELEKANAHFTGCPQASENGPETEQHASANQALLPIGEAPLCGGRVTGIESLSDESVLHFYEDIRQQVAADLAAGNRYRFLGEAAKRQAERLRMEIDRRRLKCNRLSGAISRPARRTDQSPAL